MEDFIVVEYRSNRSEVFCKKGGLRNCSKFAGKSHLFNKVAGLRPATLVKKSLSYWCFPVNFVNFVRTPVFIEHLRWLLLRVATKKTWAFAYKKLLHLEFKKCCSQKKEGKSLMKLI